MSQILILLLVFCFLLLGFLGAILPIIPGPIISYLAILLMHFFTDVNFTNNEIVMYAIITILVFVSDYILQFLGVKKLGGKKNAIYGTVLGILIGLFIPPVGLILGPFLGAFLGALIDNKEEKQALHIAFGALLGFIFGTLIKLIYSVWVIFIILDKIDFCIMFNLFCS